MCTRARGFDTVGQQDQRLPRGADGALVLAPDAAEDVRLGTQEPPPLENPREASLRLEWNTAGFGVLRVLGGDDDLKRIPEYMPVLDLQHFPEPAGCLQRADDAVAHRCAR